MRFDHAADLARCAASRSRSTTGRAPFCRRVDASRARSGLRRCPSGTGRGSRAGAWGFISLPSRLIRMTSPWPRRYRLQLSSQSRKLLYWSAMSPATSLNECDLLGQAGAQRIGAGDDDAVVDPHLDEGVTAGANLREEVLVRHGDLAVLVTALFFIGDLVFDLQRAGARLDHLAWRADKSPRHCRSRRRCRR